MARCSCSGQSASVLVAGINMDIAGVGIPDDPYILNATGASGPSCPVPDGGTDGQVLTKLSDIDCDLGWADPTTGGGTGGGNVVTGIQTETTSTSITSTLAGPGTSDTETDGAIAIGQNALVEAPAEYGVAIGYNSDCRAYAAVCLGHGTDAANQTDVVIGNGAATILSSGFTAANVAIGSGARAGDLTADSDSAIAIGNGAQARSQGSVVIGEGFLATTPGEYAVVVGDNKGGSHDPGRESVAIGAHVDGPGNFATAVGAECTAFGSNATTVGYQAEADGIESAAFGKGSTAGADQALSVGGRSAAMAASAVALGYQAAASGAGSVALGFQAVASAANEFVLGNAAHHVEVPGLFNLVPDASAPASPVNGDMWITAAGAFARVNGATVNLGGGAGGFAWRAVARSTSYTAVSGDYVIVDATAGAVTVTVPVANGTAVGVKRIDSTTNTVLVVGASGTVNGDPNAQIVGRHTSALFLADGTNLQVVADYAGGGGVGGLQARTTSTATSASLAPNATDGAATITLPIGHRLLSVQTSRPARVRLYETAAGRTADLSRALGTDPVWSSGVILEFVTSGTGVNNLDPVVDGASMETTPSTSFALTVTNMDTVTGTVAVTFGYVRTE